MARSESSVVWTVVAVVGAALVAAAVFFGPKLWREGRAFVGPIAELSRFEEEARKLNEEFPFEAPEQGGLVGERVDEFLGIRRELVAHYERWLEVERRVERDNPDSWEGAKEILAVTRDVVRTQAELLRSHGMSPAEFRWLEGRVYDWHEAVEGTTGTFAGTSELVRVTDSDLEFLGELEAAHGRGRALTEMRRRLEGRRAELLDPARPRVEGYTEAETALLWERRGAIAELTLERYATIHNALRQPGGGGFNVEIEAGRRRDEPGPAPSPAGGATPRPAEP